MRLSMLSALPAVVGVFVGSSGAVACLVQHASGQLVSCMPGCSDDLVSSTVQTSMESQGKALSVPSALAGMSGGGESVTTVHVYGFDFSTNPSSGPVVDPVISVGDTIHWVFDASFHTVTSVSGSAESFNSGTIFTAGATFDHTFTQAGTFQYYCAIHGFDNGNGTAGGMAGLVTVRAVPEPASALGMLLLGSRRRRS